jgi:hypothetical protein
VGTVGGLISVVEGTLIWAGMRGEVTPATALLVIGAAASLGGSDAIFSTKGRISPVYLAESLVEIRLIGFWVFGLARKRDGR